MRRVMDVTLAGLALILFSPLLLAAALGVRCASRGPVLYRARRVGQGGRLFTMYKFRTMHVARGPQSPITAGRDPRIFPFGALLRISKVDELPQLFNILRGEMAIIGPRAEDPEIVARHYDAGARETLSVPPGLSSPGSLYYFVHNEAAIDGEDAEAHYVREALPMKLALDRVYLRCASLGYDLRLIARTIGIILQTLAGRRTFPDPPEMDEAVRLLQAREEASVQNNP